MKRFIVFACEDYYPNGGAGDIVGSADSFEEAQAIGSDAADWKFVDYPNDPYWHVEKETASVLDTVTDEEWWVRNSGEIAKGKKKPIWEPKWEKEAK